MRAKRLAVAGAVAVVLLAACAGNDPPSTDDSGATPSPAPFTEADAAPTERASAVALAAPDDEDLEIRHADGFEVEGSGWAVGKSTRDGVTVDLAYRGGAYEMNLEVPKGEKLGATYRSFAPDNTDLWTAVDVAVEARKAGDPGPFGLMCFEQTDEVGGYEFLLDGDGTVAIVKRTGQRHTPLAEDVIPDAIHPRGGNKLRIQCFSEDGDVHLRLFVNDQEVMRTVDVKEPLYRRGGTGMLVGTGPGGSVTAAFDDFLFKGDR